MQKCYNGSLVWPCQNVVLKRRGAFATEDTEQSRIHLPWQSLAKGGAKVQELVYSATPPAMSGHWTRMWTWTLAECARPREQCVHVVVLLPCCT